MCTAWLILTGTQTIGSVGDMARFGGILFRMLAPLQLAMVVFLRGAFDGQFGCPREGSEDAGPSADDEAEQQRTGVGEVAWPVYATRGRDVVSRVCRYFALDGVISGAFHSTRSGRVFAVTLGDGIWRPAASVRPSRLWREKTFQTLALTALVIVFWVLGLRDDWRLGILGASRRPASIGRCGGVWLSPLRAVSGGGIAHDGDGVFRWAQDPVSVFLLLAVDPDTMALNAASRFGEFAVWNPSREVRRIAASGRWIAREHLGCSPRCGKG